MTVSTDMSLEATSCHVLTEELTDLQNFLSAQGAQRGKPEKTIAVDVVPDSSHACSLGFLLLFVVWSIPLYILRTAFGHICFTVVFLHSLLALGHHAPSSIAPQVLNN